MFHLSRTLCLRLPEDSNPILRWPATLAYYVVDVFTGGWIPYYLRLYKILRAASDSCHLPLDLGLVSSDIHSIHMRAHGSSPPGAWGTPQSGPSSSTGSLFDTLSDCPED